jgi:hypothetical protein
MKQHPSSQFLRAKAMRQWTIELAEAVALETDDKVQAVNARKTLMGLLAGRTSQRTDLISYAFFDGLFAFSTRVSTIHLGQALLEEFLVGRSAHANDLRVTLTKKRDEALARICKAGSHDDPSWLS